MIDVFVAQLETRIQRLEKWCQEHETEGLDYGNEITDEMNIMRDSISRLATQMMLMTDAILSVNDRLDRIHEI